MSGTSDRLSITVGAARLELVRLDDTQPQILTLPVQGPAGQTGLSGAPGPQGPQGDQGIQGERGPSGSSTAKAIAASAVQAVLTGTLAETALATINIAARIIGKDGRLRVTTLWTCTGSANIKTARVRFSGVSGTIYHDIQLTTSTVHKAITEIDNRGVVNSQVGQPSSMDSYGVSTSSLVTSSIDTDAATSLVLTGQLANVGETIRLEAYIVELLMPPEQADKGLYFAGDGILINQTTFEIKVDRTNVANVVSPIFTGTPQAPTVATADNTNKISTTQFVQTNIGLLSTVYMPRDPATARALLGLGALALLNTVAWAQIDASLAATIANYRTGADQKFFTPKTAFDAHAYVALTDAASIAIDLSTGFNFAVTITLNRELAFPTNMKVGQNGFIDVTQPSGGGKSLSFGVGYTFDGGVTPTIDTVASRTTSFYYHVRSSTEVRLGIAFRGVRAGT